MPHYAYLTLDGGRSWFDPETAEFYSRGPLDRSEEPPVRGGVFRVRSRWFAGFFTETGSGLSPCPIIPTKDGARFAFREVTPAWVMDRYAEQSRPLPLVIRQDVVWWELLGGHAPAAL